MAEILRTAGKFKESFEYLDSVLKSRPDYDFALFNRTLLYYAIGDYTGMQKDFHKINTNLIDSILAMMRIRKLEKNNPNQIYKILAQGLKMAKGNRRKEEYFLQIQFPQYVNIGSTRKISNVRAGSGASSNIVSFFCNQV